MAVTTNKPYDGPIYGGGGGGGGGGGATGGGYSGPGGSLGGILGGFNFKQKSKIKLPGLDGPPAPQPQTPAGFGESQGLMQNAGADTGSFLGGEYHPYFGIGVQGGQTIPVSQLGMDPTVLAMQAGRPDGSRQEHINALNQELYNAALRLGYPTRQRAQQIDSASNALGNYRGTPRVSGAPSHGQQIGGQRPDSYLAARDRRYGEMM